MGRRKILINQITDPKLRNITFLKRKQGLIKKAAELSLLCNVNMLLIFEDGNGNLIQFSRNKITTIPSFFKECTYSSVSEFTANDYPNFFNGNQKRKRRGRKNDEESHKEAVTEQEDGFPVLEELTRMASEAQRSQKGENITIAPSSTYEDFLSPGMVSYSSSEEPSHDERDEIHTIPDIQMRESYDNQLKPSHYMMSKSEEIGGNHLEEREPYLNKREPCQNKPMRGPIIEDKPTDYIQPHSHMPYKRPIPRRSFIEDRHHHPYRNYPFEHNMPPYHPNHWPYNYYHDPYLHRPPHFSNYMRPKSRVSREMSEEEAVDQMFRYPPKEHGMDPSERNEFIHMPPNYVKDRERVANFVDPGFPEINPHHYSAYSAYDDSNPEENLSVPFYSSEKFTSKSYANTFESDGFNEFSDPQKKLKQG